MTAFLITYCILGGLGVALNLMDLGRGVLPKPVTRGQQAFRVFFQIVCLAWALWLLAQGVSYA